MQIVTWNVNSIRARLPRFLPWLQARRPDVVCLQELKCRDEEFPREPIEALGYSVETFGQKTYNGVAILSRTPMAEVVRGLPGDAEEAERRVIGARVGDCTVLNLYVVNGQAVGSPRYAYKLEWMGRVAAHLRERYAMGEKLVVTGDFNVTFDDRDVHAPERWRDKILCSTPEREALRRIADCGLHDALRKFHEDAGHHTWWDFRTLAFKRGWGLRIDHFLLSSPALEACTAFEVDLDARAGEQPSDHAPVLVTL